MAARRGKRKILAIDWDTRTLRIAHALVSNRGVKIDRLINVAIPTSVDPNDPQQFGAHIRQALDQEGITTKHAAVDIPRDQVVLNTLTLPTTVPEELPGMVKIQIAKELPFPVMDAAVDYTVGLPVDGGTSSDVLVAAIRREVLSQYEAIFAAADLKLERVGLRPYANKVAVCELLQHAMPHLVLFIDVRPTFMEISVLREGSLVFSRAASVAMSEGEDLTGACPVDGPASLPANNVADATLKFTDAETQPACATAMVALLMEVTRSIEAYRASDAGAEIDHVVIAGDTGMESLLSDAIQARLHVTTEMYNPARTFGWEPDEGANAAAFAAVMGLILSDASDDQFHFDFLHPKKTESAARKRLKKAPMIAAVAVLFIVASVMGVVKFTASDRARLASLNEQITELKGQRSANKKFLKLHGVLDDFDESQRVWVDVLVDVVSVFPTNEEMIFDRIDLKQIKVGAKTGEHAQIVFRTRCKKRSTPTELIKSLHAFVPEQGDWRLRASMGSQSPNLKESYPFAQDIRIEIVSTKKSGKKHRKGVS